MSSDYFDEILKQMERQYNTKLSEREKMLLYVVYGIGFMDGQKSMNEEND